MKPVLEGRIENVPSAIRDHFQPIQKNITSTQQQQQQQQQN